MKRNKNSSCKKRKEGSRSIPIKKELFAKNVIKLFCLQWNNNNYDTVTDTVEMFYSLHRVFLAGRKTGGKRVKKSKRQRFLVKADAHSRTIIFYFYAI